MPEEQVANISEALCNIEEGLTAMSNRVKGLNEGFDAILDLFYTMLTNETAHHNIYNNKEQKHKTVTTIKNMIDANKKDSPVIEQGFTLLLTNLKVTKMMISQANKEGAKII